MRNAVRISLLVCLALAGCGVSNGPLLVSAQFPPGVGASNSQPQPITSLPPGAANVSAAPNGYQANSLAVTLGGLR